MLGTRRNKWMTISFVIFLNTFHELFAFEPITTTAVIGGIAAGIWKYEPAADYVFGKLLDMERCSDRSIPWDINGLKRSFEENVFGQHIAYDVVIKALDSHRWHMKSSKKPLVMSFHGTPGTGKNFVSDMIAKFLYKEGLNSKFVHKFSGRLKFSNVNMIDFYKVYIKDLLLNAARQCERSLFIFDEVDSIPVGILDTVTSLFDHHDKVEGVDFRKAIFIFLSNHGGVEISDRLFSLYRQKHKDREETNLADYEDILQLVAYNKEGGLKNSLPIEHGLIDHFIPFLPMEKRHIRQCIVAEFKRLGIRPTEDQITQMFQYVTFDRDIFAKNGCKKITKKAEIHI